MIPRLFTVNARKYDLSLRRSWQAELVEQTDSLIKLLGVFEKDVEHSDLGHIPAGTHSLETFPFMDWFNYFTFYNPDGSVRNHYFNICLPPKVTADAVDYVDLDIDIVVWPNGKVDVLDVEEFKENVSALNYPNDVVDKAMIVAETVRNTWQDII